MSDKIINNQAQDEYWMQIALDEAQIAITEDEVPVGAVIIYNGILISKAHNRTQTLKDPTAHAEILAIREAAQILQQPRLDNCDIYVTLEPCSMCAGALVWSHIHRLVFAAYDIKSGACGSLWNLAQNPKLNHQLEITSGILAENSSNLLKQFFAKQ